MSKDKTKARITKLGKEMSEIRNGVSPYLQSILSDLKSGFYSDSSASLKTLMEVGARLESLEVKETLTNVIYEMLQLLATIDWSQVLWKEATGGDGKLIPRVVIHSTAYYDDEFKKNNYELWTHSYIDGIASEDDFLQRFILPYLPNIDKCKELVGKAKKGTLVYTDIPLVQKLESAPKIIENGTGKSQNKEDIPQSDNIVTLSERGNSQDYIFGRLKRDAELGDEKAIEVVEKVKNGVYTSARQVALEMGYRKPVKQKCLPKDTKKAVEKIVRELGEDYATQLALEILGKNKN